jgi:hypothetical protein
MIYFLVELESDVALLVDIDASLNLPESTIRRQTSSAHHVILVIHYEVSDRSHVFETPFPHLIVRILFIPFGLLLTRNQ